MISALLSETPYATKQRIVGKKQGISAQKQGILIAL
jgi:hypothetical protein